MKLLYVNAYGSNFGDEFGVEIVRRMLGRNLRTCDLWKYKKRRSPGVLALGSILHFTIERDVIWGTGVNPTWKPDHKCQSLDIRAVRGPLTRSFVQENWGLTVPPVYGDPAMLAKRLFPDKQWNPVRTYGVIPHHHDTHAIDDVNVMLPSQHWNVVLDYILGCELVISSSLHGIVLAEAFGVPSRWLRSSTLPSIETENEFKYNDYYACTDRSLNDWSKTVQDALVAGGKEPFSNFDPNPLIRAFPREMFENTDPIREYLDRKSDSSSGILGDRLRFRRIQEIYYRWRSEDVT
jgi:pyruvyltransferase